MRLMSSNSNKMQSGDPPGAAAPTRSPRLRIRVTAAAERAVRVREAVSALNYTPYAAARSLAGRRTATIGHAAYLTSTVADVTGAPARTFGDWAAANADRFRR